MAIQNPYKQYERQQRTQLSETSFGEGMQFTNVPLSENLSRLLVNVNISDDGFTLSPREGLINYLSSTPGNTLELTERSSLKIVDTQVVYTEDEVNYHHIVLLQKDSKEYKLRHMIIQDGEHYFSGLYDCKYYKEPLTEIHKVPLENNDLIIPTGGFAWNGDYFYFSDTGSLFKTVWDSEEKEFSIEPVEMPDVSARDVPLPGYNMLHEHPYTFTDNTNDLIRTFLGIICYKPGDDYIPELNPKVNAPYKYRAYYEGHQTNDTILWEWKEAGASSWNKILETHVDTEAIEVEFTSPSKEFMIRVTCTNGEEVTSQLAKVYYLEDYADKKSEMINYDLSTTKNISYWKRRLIIGGTKEDRTMLFMSLADDPGYFPYSTWTDQFPEPIQNIVPFLDNLLVFTNTQLYQITLDEVGTFTKICLQENLNINGWDKHLTQIVKNMLFFKSGNYYYMVVPKANSLTGELTIAPITRNMKEFFDDFENNVAYILENVYDYREKLKLVHYYNFLDYESIYNVYMYQVREKLYINVCLLYNSVKRYWKINIYESKSQLFPLIQDATKSGVLVQLSDTFRKMTQNESSQHDGAKYMFKYYLEYLRHDPNNLLEKSELFQNTMYIDTGYREHNSDLKKRYRELQLIVDNTTCRHLHLFTNFYVDGESRQSSYKYEPIYNENEGTITMQKVFSNPLSVTGNTILDEWELDFSEFPSTTVWKLRAPVSGKGYSPRLVIRSNEPQPFKILKTCWVYRLMNSR